MSGLQSPFPIRNRVDRSAGGFDHDARMVTKAEWDKQIRAMSADELRQHWDRDFGNLREDVLRILSNREVFEALDAEIVRTERAGSGYFLGQFLRPTYVQSQALLLRRLGDGDRRSSSFRIMLEEMILRPDMLTRKWYVGRWAEHYPGDDFMVHMGDDEFSDEFGENAPHVPVEVLTTYRDDLEADLERVKRFADQFIAHRDRETLGPITWNDLNTAIDRLDHHLNVVGRIVTGAVTLTAARITDDWRNVFRSGLFSDDNDQR